MKNFIIIPAYNEEKTISSVINKVQEFGQVIVIDDSSTDDTKQIAKQTDAIVLSHIVNRGQGAALQTGMDYALQNNADIIIHFDADGQHSVQDMQKMIEPILKNEVDIVLGSRFLPDTRYQIPDTKIPLTRHVMLKAAVIFTKFISDINITDTHNGFRVLSKKAAKKIKISQDRMAHASEILDEIIKNNLRYKEVSVYIEYTDYSLDKGQSSWGFVNILKELLIRKLFK